MNTSLPLAAIACTLLLLAAAQTAFAQQDGPGEDPFADEPGLFEDEEEDPFAELEERAQLDEENETETNDGGDDTGDADGGEEQDRIPAPIGAAIAGLLLAAGALDRWRSRL